MTDAAATRLGRQERNPIHAPNTAPPEEIAAQYVRDTPAGQRGINLGCGGMTFKDWLNIDIDQPHHADIVWDLRKGLPFPPLGQFDAVYSEAFFEHVKREEAEKLLRDACRVLKPGGHVRIAVPDLRQLVRIYLTDEKHPETSDPIHREYGRAFGTACELFNYAMRGEGHSWMYDRPEIDALFAACGFVEIRACESGESSVPLLRGMDNRPGCSLITEGTKPG